MDWLGKPGIPSIRRFGLEDPPDQVVWRLCEGENPQVPIEVRLGGEKRAWILGWFTYRAGLMLGRGLSFFVRNKKKPVVSEMNAEELTPSNAFELAGEVSVICNSNPSSEDVSGLKDRIRHEIAAIIDRRIREHPEEFDRAFFEMMESSDRLLYLIKEFPQYTEAAWKLLRVNTTQGLKRLCELSESIDTGSVWATSSLHIDTLHKSCRPGHIVVDLISPKVRSTFFFLMERFGKEVPLADLADSEFRYEPSAQSFYKETAPEIEPDWLVEFFRRGLNDADGNNDSVIVTKNNNVITVDTTDDHRLRSLPAMIFIDKPLKDTSSIVSAILGKDPVSMTLRIRKDSMLAQAICKLDKDTRLVNSIPHLVFNFALLFLPSSVPDELQMRHWEKIVVLMSDYSFLSSKGQELSPNDSQFSEIKQELAEKNEEIKKLSEGIDILSHAHGKSARRSAHKGPH